MNGHARPRWMRFLVVCAVFGLAAVPAQAEFLLTAEVMPTIGLDGFDTYRITATSDLGNIVGFDFSEVGSYGLTGPMHQVNPFDTPTIFNDLPLSVFNIDNSQDTRFLFNSADVVSLFTTETNEALHGVFALGGDKQLTIGNSVPFLQIATSQSSQVNLKGSFVVRRPNDALIEYAIDVPLSAIRVGAAPQLSVLPISEPALPVVPTAPSIPTPGPIAQPILPIGGIGDGPMQNPVSPPASSPLAPATPPVSDGRIFLTTEISPTIGREGFNTYRITATSNVGSVVGVDLSEVGGYGLSGPIGQVNPFGSSTVFHDQLNVALDPRDSSQDTQFLVRSDDVASLFTNENENGLNGIFALMGKRQFSAGQSLPFLQVSTADPSAVNLRGSLMIRRADGKIVEDKFDLNLAHMQIGAAPLVELLPIPEPILPPAPPLVSIPPTSPEPGFGPVRPPDENLGGILAPGIVESPVLPPTEFPSSPVEPPNNSVEQPPTSTVEITTGEHFWRVNSYPYQILEVPLMEYTHTDITDWTYFEPFHGVPIELHEDQFFLNRVVNLDSLEVHPVYTSGAILRFASWTSDSNLATLGGVAAFAMSDATGDLASVPEPASALLLVFGLLSCGRRSWRQMAERPFTR